MTFQWLEVAFCGFSEFFLSDSEWLAVFFVAFSDLFSSGATVAFSGSEWLTVFLWLFRSFFREVAHGGFFSGSEWLAVAFLSGEWLGAFFAFVSCRRQYSQLACLMF